MGLRNRREQMKLFLTSKAFENESISCKLKGNIGLSIENSKVLFIPTALGDEFSPNKYFDELINFGFKSENIIIFNHKKAREYIDLKIDILYISGGNTFTLLKTIKECGFINEIKKYLEIGVLGICRSAGTHLMTKNVEHILNFDENKVCLEDFDAMGIFDGIVFCHYTEEREEFYNKAVEENKYNVYKITDEEVIIIDNESILIV